MGTQAWLSESEQGSDISHKAPVHTYSFSIYKFSVNV